MPQARSPPWSGRLTLRGRAARHRLRLWPGAVGGLFLLRRARLPQPVGQPPVQLRQPRGPALLAVQPALLDGRVPARARPPGLARNPCTDLAWNLPRNLARSLARNTVRNPRTSPFATACPDLERSAPPPTGPPSAWPSCSLPPDSGQHAHGPARPHRAAGTPRTRRRLVQGRPLLSRQLARPALARGARPARQAPAASVGSLRDKEER